MVAPYTRSYYASNPPTMLAGRFGGGFAGAVQLGGVAMAGSFDGPIVPTWLVGKPLNEWFEIPGSTIAGTVTTSGVLTAAIFHDYSGVVPYAGTKIIAFGGGHGGQSDNTVASFDLATGTGWTVLRQPTPSGQRVLASNGDTMLDRFWWADGAPNPPHTYSSGQWIPELNRIIWFDQRGVWSYSGNHPHARWCQFKLDSNTWVQPGDADDVTAPTTSRMACRTVDGKVLASNGGTSIFQYDPTQPFASRWTTWTTNGALNWNGYGQYMHDAVGNRLIRIGDFGTARYFAIDMTTKAVTDIAPLLTGDAGVITAMNTRIGLDTCGACIDPINNRIVIPTGAVGGGFYAIDLATFAVTMVTPPVVGGNTIAGTPIVSSAPGGLFNRIHYNETLKCLIYAPNGSANMCAMRLAI
jgi:hypothetical protein